MRFNLGKYFMTGAVTGINAGAWLQVFPSSLNLRGGLMLNPSSGNKDIVFVGNSGVTSANGYPMLPGTEHYFRVDDVSGVWLTGASISGNSTTFWFAS